MSIRSVFFSAILLALAVSTVSLRSSAADDGGRGWSSLPAEARSSILTALGKSEGYKGNWVQQAELTAKGGKDGDLFGNSVAIAGDTVVVGVPGAGRRSGQGSGKGAVYVFVKPAKGWKTTDHATAKLTVADGTNCSWSSCSFGGSVAIDGDTIMAGSNASSSGRSGTGAIYVYLKPAGGWKTTSKFDAKIVGPNVGYDNFGYPLSLSGDTVVSGAQGAGGVVYAIVKPPSGWKGQLSYNATLTPWGGRGRGVRMRFGAALSVSGNTVVVGAPQFPEENSQGAVFVFVKPVTGWTNMTQTARLAASDGTNGDLLGWGVAIEGDTVVAGAPRAPFGGDRSGTSYVFVRPKGGWKDMTQAARLTPSEQVPEDFGSSVAISGNEIAVGADGGGSSGQGSGYVFVRPAGGWVDASEPATVTALDGQTNDEFGYSVAVGAHTVVAGARYAPFNSSGSPGPGAAYIFGK